jgi:hypothetical protein
MTTSTRTISAFARTAANNLHRLALPGDLPKPSRLAAFVKAKTSASDKKASFTTVLTNVRSSNIQRLKDRAFLANRLAKIAVGASRTTCYRLKDAAVNALVRHGAASLHSISGLPYGPNIGLVFVDGGRLHIPPSHLDPSARRRVQQQFGAALYGVDQVDLPPTGQGERFYDLGHGAQL